jgi:pimeloyl-ACP methyl ester carboxylesterase
MAGEDFAADPEIRDLWVELERLPSSARSLRDVAHAMLRVRGPRHEVELTADQLSALRVPVQLIWGERDPSGRRVGRRAAESSRAPGSCRPRRTRAMAA